MFRVWAIPLIPLLGFVYIGLLSRRLSRRAAAIVGCSTVALSFLVSLEGALQLLRGEEALTATFYTWASLGDTLVRLDYRLDALSGSMALIVSGVGFLIHLYSVGYMHGDRGFNRYFAFLNLFIFFMLTLVLSDNLLLTFVGWEGVGLCSYLLIGFWYEKSDPPPAAVKAFVVNRIGDFGFLTAMVLLLAQVGTLSISELLQSAPGAFEAWPVGALAVGLLLFLAATGKSAQVPLYVWLPDAMAGPTPVSALIHAATMVTAGVYLMARFRPILELQPQVLEVICAVGAVTALLAALIALAQRDIKRVLAYSTVSQLGYMFMGVAAGGGVAGMFHLTTHAFFKALLFLGAGSVIHAMGGEQDITKMGGLRSKTPITFWTCLVGALALAGLFPTAGFYSKDLILADVLHFGEWGRILFAMGVLTAGLTAFYTARWLMLIFFGEYRSPHHHPHESPAVMTVPLVLLAIFSFGAGWGEHAYAHFVGRVLEPPEGHVPGQVIAWASGAGIVGLLAGFLRYRSLVPGPGPAKGLARVSERKFWVDEIYDALIVRPYQFLSKVIASWVDGGLIDTALVNGSGALVRAAGRIVRPLQNGQIQVYTLAMMVGLVAALGWMLWS
ncbi:MAG: NADH-quinone oxidoreductase subunit L [Nitrospirae bacterium]|nr:NADH-quinone oxidoreductase subunit L [Nitrospirota bacterium]